MNVALWIWIGRGIVVVVVVESVDVGGGDESFEYIFFVGDWMGVLDGLSFGG